MLFLAVPMFMAVVTIVISWCWSHSRLHSAEAFSEDAKRQSAKIMNEAAKRQSAEVLSEAAKRQSAEVMSDTVEHQSAEAQKESTRQTKKSGSRQLTDPDSELKVRLIGLAARPDLNGRLGVTCGYDSLKQRVRVRLEGADNSLLSVRSCNLEIFEENVSTASTAPVVVPGSMAAVTTCGSDAGTASATTTKAAKATSAVSERVVAQPPATETAATTARAASAKAVAQTVERPAVAPSVISTAIDSRQHQSGTRDGNSSESASASTPLIEILKARRQELFAKNARRELDVHDLVGHSKFIDQQASLLRVKRDDIARKHTLTHARLRREKRDLGKICALVTQGEKLEQAAEEFNTNVAALNAEKDWLHETDAWKAAVKELRDKYVETASGEVIPKATLEQDEAELCSFEDMLQELKATATDPKGDMSEPESICSQDGGGCGVATKKKGKKKKRPSGPK